MNKQLSEWSDRSRIVVSCQSKQAEASHETTVNMKLIMSAVKFHNNGVVHAIEISP